ncbi:ATP-dependent helicase smarcad1 [Branchiostoma belcheri]|nr:ATP-dependent helicase smarcad1 [Branchiostoma belcheri]
MRSERPPPTGNAGKGSSHPVLQCACVVQLSRGRGKKSFGLRFLGVSEGTCGPDKVPDSTMSLQMTLDRFRFQKKGGKDQGEGSNNRPCTPENTIDVDCIPETPQSQQPSPASPVVMATKTKKKQGQALQYSDSEGEGAA